MVTTNLNLLLQALQELLGDEIKEYKFNLKLAEGKLRANLYRLGNVLSEQVDTYGNWHLIVRLKKRDFLFLTY